MKKIDKTHKTRSLLHFILIICLVTPSLTSLKAQEVKSGSSGSVSIGDMKLTLEEAIALVLRNNLTLQKAKYDVLMSDSMYLSTQGRYAIQAQAEASYNQTHSPETGMSSTFGGANSNELKATFSLQKIFETGTMLRIGVTETIYDQDDKAIPGFKPTEDPAYHKPVFFVTVQQELLKNAFGVHDRQTLRKLKTESQIAREALIHQLSSLVVEALSDYWAVIVAKGSLANAELAVRSTQNLRNIVAKNLRLGLAESYELSLQNAALEQAQSRLEMAKQTLKVAVRKLLRTINLPADTQVEGITQLIDRLPELDAQKALEAAFKKRADYNNLLQQIEVARLNLQLAENNALPSVIGFFELSTLGQNENVGTAIGDTISATYPTWTVGVRVSYPFGDKSLSTAIRNAKFELKKAQIELEEANQRIRDEVLDSLEAVRFQFNILMNTRKYRQESENYYFNILAQARRGRFNTSQVKDALDLMIGSRQAELQELVNYNVRLLMFDLAKNEIFERYKVDIEKLLKEVR